MNLAFPDVQDTNTVVTMLAPRHYQEVAIAAYEDAELLLSSILPDARIEHVGASAVPGAYSRGGVDVCVAVPRGAFDEALGVLVEAGYLAHERHEDDDDGERLAVLAAPHGDVAATLRLVETGSSHEALMRFRDALRGDGALLARYNAVRIEAAPRGAAAYAQAKASFLDETLAR